MNVCYLILKKVNTTYVHVYFIKNLEEKFP